MEFEKLCKIAKIEKKYFNVWMTPQLGNIFKLTGFSQNEISLRVVVETIKGKTFNMNIQDVQKLLEISQSL